LDYRRSYRKGVKLAGIFTVPSESKKIERTCTILDISATGMQIVTDYFKNISEGQPIDATIILDDKLRTRVELHCVVRHIIPDKARKQLRLEFVNLNPNQQQVLGSYLMP
jgi:c-di-GMP-binding flagellar brake protein YcgR